MKNVSVEMNLEVLVAVANLFDIETEGVETEKLVEQINTAIESLKSNKSRAKAKWYEAEGANPYAEGQTVKIVAGPGLIGRFAEVVRPSSKANAIKAYLLTPKEGERQGTLITLDFENIEASEFVPVAPKVTKQEETPAAEAEESQVVDSEQNVDTAENVNEESSEEVKEGEVVA